MQILIFGLNATPTIGMELDKSVYWTKSNVKLAEERKNIFNLYTRASLNWILKWCNIQDQQFKTVGEMVKFAAIWGNCPKKRKILLAIIYGYLWCTWKARNDKEIFNSLDACKEGV
ncbi:hypothetical protein LXL04_021768 [Taraxacum kok-saghyz]